MQPIRRIELIVHIAISVLPGTHLHLSEEKHVRVKRLAQENHIETMSLSREDETWYFSVNLHKVGIEPARDQ